MKSYFKILFLYLFSLLLIEHAYASNNQSRHLKKSLNSYKSITPKSFGSSGIPLEQRLISNNVSLSGQSFLNQTLSNINQSQNRPEAIRASLNSNSITNDINNLKISLEEPSSPISRDLIGDGSNPQIAQQEDGSLWVSYLHDGSGDGFVDMMIYKSSDDGISWQYQFYIYNTSADLGEVDIEAIDDRLIFLFKGNVFGIFWVLYNYATEDDYGTVEIVAPDGYDQYEWGSIIADKFYYDIEDTWLYVSLLAYNQTSGRTAIFYSRSIDMGMTWDNLTAMWEEVEGADGYLTFRPGLAAAYSTPEPGTEVDHFWTTFDYNDDIYVSKIDVYTNEVTLELVMEAADDLSSYFGAPSISAYFDNIVVFSQIFWDDGEDVDSDVAVTFSYDDGVAWGEDYPWYYWGNEDGWEYHPSPTFALDGGMGFVNVKNIIGTDGYDYNSIEYRTNLTGNFLNGWSFLSVIDEDLGENSLTGSVIQNEIFSLVYDDIDNQKVYFDSRGIDPIEYGVVSGVITNAVNNLPVQGALVTIGGDLSVYTDASGNYTINDVPLSVFEASFFALPVEGDAPLNVQMYNTTSEGGTAISITADGFAGYYDNSLIINPNETVYYNASISPIDDNWLRFVLNWDDSPEDLDIHLITSSSHIYYGNPGDESEYPYATLDVDVTEGYGPETITIGQASPEDYKIYVYNYTQDPGISESQAVIQAYSFGQQIFTINAPREGNGLYWHVADFNGQTGTYTLVDQIVSQEPSFDGGSGGSNEITVSITTDSYPSETYWELRDYYTEEIISSVASGEITQANSTVEWVISVPTSAYMFYIYDIYGDGICCSYGDGSFSIYADGNPVTEGYAFNSAEASVFINFISRSSGSYVLNSSSYVEAIPFSKGTYLTENFVESWPKNPYVLIEEGSFGNSEHLVEVKPLNYSRNLNYTWDFGDGNTSSEESPSHTYVNAGSYSVILSVSDGANNSIFFREDYITVSGEQNSSPVVTNAISDRIINEGQNEEFNLLNIFSDPDGDVLSYNVQSSNSSSLVVDVTNVTLTIYGTSDGSSDITVTASDPYGETASFQFNVIVNASNTNPIVVNEIPDIEIVVGETFSLNLITSQIFADLDGDDLTYSAVSSNEYIITAGIVNSFELFVSAVTAGVADVVLVAQDGNGGNVSTQFSVTVSTPSAASAPPILYEIPDIVLDEDGTSVPVDLDDYVSDDDTELGDLFWFASVASSGNLLVQIDPVNHFLAVSSNNHWNGQTNFSILVSDGQNLAMAVIDVIVNPINDAPVIMPMTGIIFLEDHTLELPHNDYIHDIDNDDLDISFENSENVLIELINGQITFSALSNWNGQEVAVINVSDGEHLISSELPVVVVPVNDAPVATSLISPLDNVSLDNSSVEFAWQAAEEVDVNDQISYKVFVSNDPSFSEILYESMVNELTVTIDIEEVGSMHWFVQAIDLEDAFADYATGTFSISALSTINSGFVPNEFALKQNYPNPFNPSTKIQFHLPENSHVNLTIYDLRGNVIKVLNDSELNKGIYTYTWDAKNKISDRVSAGMYIYTINAGEFRTTRKMILLK